MSIPLPEREEADAVIHCKDGKVRVHGMYLKTFFPSLNKQKGKKSLPFSVRVIQYITDIWYNPDFVHDSAYTIDSKTSSEIIRALDHMGALFKFRSALYEFMVTHLTQDHSHGDIECMHSVFRCTHIVPHFLKCATKEVAHKILYSIHDIPEVNEFVNDMLSANISISKIAYRQCPWILHARVSDANKRKYSDCVAKMILRAMTPDEVRAFCRKSLVEAISLGTIPMAVTLVGTIELALGSEGHVVFLRSLHRQMVASYNPYDYYDSD